MPFSPRYEVAIGERAALAHLLGDATASQRELRNAHKPYTEFGATGHADRVARKLGQAS